MENGAASFGGGCTGGAVAGGHQGAARTGVRIDARKSVVATVHI